MNDFFGQPLSIGDEVAFEQPGYRNLIKGKIVSFTPKFVNVEWIDPVYTVGSPYAVKKFRVSPSDVVKSPSRDCWSIFNSSNVLLVTLTSINDVYAYIRRHSRDSQDTTVVWTRLNDWGENESSRDVTKEVTRDAYSA